MIEAENGRCTETGLTPGDQLASGQLSELDRTGEVEVDGIGRLVEGEDRWRRLVGHTSMLPRAHRHQE